MPWDKLVILNYVFSLRFKVIVQDRGGGQFRGGAGAGGTTPGPVLWDQFPDQTGLRECFDTAVSLGVATEGVATNSVGTNGLPTKSVD